MSLKSELNRTHHSMKEFSRTVKTERWQAQDLSQVRGSEMVELLHHNIRFKLPSENLGHYRRQVQPNLPWADNHFLERVSGAPMNPGTEWKNWPWAKKSEDSLDADGKFNHNYMERYWPQWAHLVEEPTTDKPDWMVKASGVAASNNPNETSMRGIRAPYGDLAGLVRVLANEPTTRQAYLPIWFPEDTGDAHLGRKPCSLGYHFIMRNDKLDIVYYIRSCDYYRHFRDDIYLTIRLLLWVLSECRMINPTIWNKVEPGEFLMNITSLHMFLNDYYLLYKERPRG